MNTSTKATAILLGNLGRAVLEHMNRVGKPAIDIYLGSNLIQQAPWPERAATSGQQEEEIVFVVAELKEVNQFAFHSLKQHKIIQNNSFVVLITVAPAEENSQQAVRIKRQEVQASVDSFLVLPSPASLNNPSQDKTILEAITKTLGYLANLMLENDKVSLLIDFEDIKTVLESSEIGAVGLGRAGGVSRAVRAVEIATSPPFMTQAQLTNANRVLLQIGAGKDPELEMDELTEMTDAVQEKCGEDSEVIFGHYVDEQLGSKIEIFLIVVQ